MTKCSTADTNMQEYVILLHGLARSERSLRKLALALEKRGYRCINHSYPSTKHDIATLADVAVAEALSLCGDARKINFVTHSMGGILVRQYLSQHHIDNLGRVVMLGPPNQGSEVVDTLHNVPGFRFINGPAGMQLGTEAMSVPNRLGDVNFELGVIAGTRSINILLSTMLPKPNDGKVSVERTKLAGMKDHIALPVTHPLMMNNAKVIEQTVHFLVHGVFNH
ncbi:esterase/lipase family protein [Shewanella psychrotolerans]|uniref:esterase/lipase family protein n=1 Tax=Shewanella psychrotolerans TaxID=2864206 RepID=UPI001C65F3F3|nr:alpha/beta fold hydrolase [Shewanella psychrotolerans]QYK00196.1 alpha/beta hydrolase [Shewanella psychrotolerans]